MMFLRFKSSTASWTIGPTQSIEVRGGDLFFPHRPDPVARFQNGWVLDGQTCTHVECRATLSVQFEDAAGGIGTVFGLRTSFHLRGVYAFAGRERIAKLEPISGMWVHVNTQERWPRLRVQVQLARP